MRWIFVCLLAFILHYNKCIYHGTAVEKGEYPWMVYYRILAFSDYINMSYWMECAGSLIDPLTVLTACHCLFNPQWIQNIESIRRIELVIGAFNISNERNDIWGRQEIGEHFTIVAPIDGKDVIGHQNFWKHSWAEPYRQKTTNHDIALIRLPTAAKATPVQLDFAYSTQDGELYKSWNGEKVTVIGYGVYVNYTYSNFLRKGEILVIDHDQCNYNGYIWNGLITSGMMCTTPANNLNHVSAHGDSGGPVISCSESDNCVQIGIVSFGRINISQYPEISTQINFYTDFIVHHVPSLLDHSRAPVFENKICLEENPKDGSIEIIKIILSVAAGICVGCIISIILLKCVRKQRFVRGEVHEIHPLETR